MAKAKPDTPGRDAAGASVAPRAERSAEPGGQSDRAAARPPGRVLPGGHGPQEPIEVLTGVGRLRKMLNLSPVCDIEQVCSDAVVEIERLRAPKTRR